MKSKKEISKFSLIIKEDKIPFLLSIGLAVAYFIFSRFSQGFYQHDEAAHFVNMKGFWHDPFSVLGNWAKPGYKLIYAIPSLFGEQVVVFVNCLFAAFTSFFVYKILKQIKSEYAILGFVLLAIQPFWIQLSFRNYSEIITAFLLTLAVYFHYRNSVNWAIFILSYITLIRQEFYPIVGLYGLYVLFSKKYLAVLFALIPQLFITLWGYLRDGSLMYIYNTVVGTSDTISNAYPRQGFWHYFKMSQVIFGAIVLTLTVAYLFLKIYKKELKHWMVVIPALLFFFLHSLFNAKSLDFGPATGGNLRYMIIISPLLAIMGANIFDDLKSFSKKYTLLFVLVPYCIVFGTFMSFKHNNIVYSEEVFYIPLYFAMIISLLILIPVKKISTKVLTIIIIVLGLLLNSSTIEAYKINAEDETMKTVAEWYEDQIKQSKDNENRATYFDENSQVFASHVLFYYFQGKTSFDFRKKSLGINSVSLDTAKVGSLVIWDSHYSYRPNLRATSLPDSYFLDRPSEYTNIKNFSKDGFSVKIFVKTNLPDTLFDRGKEKFDARSYDEALGYFDEVIENHPDNYMAYFYRGQCYQYKNNIQSANENYARSVALNENFGRGHFGLGSVLLSTNNPDKAAEEFTKAIRIEVSNEMYYFMRGNAYFAKKDYANAEKDYVQAINLRTRFPEAFYNLGLSQINNNKRNAGCNNLQNSLTLGYQQAQQAIDMYCK